MDASVARSQPDGSPAGVLVIDDEPRHRELCRAAIEQTRDLVFLGEAHNGRRGVELAARLQPEAIVLDLRMPTMDGLTALPLLRRVAPFARIVVWSGDGPLELEAARDAGAAACVRKVAPVEQLVATLRAEVAARSC